MVKENLGLVGQKGRHLLTESRGSSAFISDLDGHPGPFLSSGYQ